MTIGIRNGFTRISAKMTRKLFCSLPMLRLVPGSGNGKPNPKMIEQRKNSYQDDMSEMFSKIRSQINTNCPLKKRKVKKERKPKLNPLKKNPKLLLQVEG